MTKEEKEQLKALTEKASKEKKKKKKGLFMKLIIIFMFVYLTIFSYKVLDVFEKTGNEPAALVGAVFLFCGWESGCLSKIKIHKEKNKGDENHVD